MASWPASPVAEMLIIAYDAWSPASLRAWQIDGTPADATVTDPTVEFNVLVGMVEFRQHQISANFAVELSRLDSLSSAWTVVDTRSEAVSLPLPSGSYLPTSEASPWVYKNYLTVSVKIKDPIEIYRLRLRCVITEGQEGEVNLDLIYRAIQGSSFLGDFSLDYVPVAIVYCPPGQDMTNSLTQSVNFGTRLAIGAGSGMESQFGYDINFDALGMKLLGIGSSSDEAMSDQAGGDVEISYFRNTVVTADNQKAIGRAYWGPLGDLFVIVVNPRFSASKRADGTIFYCPRCHQEQIIIVPAWKLLRPGDDAIASRIPDDARRSILSLDPFIRNLDRFFPDAGGDLREAANPHANPSANGRADPVGRWWLDNGAELTYATGETHKLSVTQTSELSYTTGAKIYSGSGANYDGISLALGVDSDGKTSITYRRSKETSASFTNSASCSLIRNQNDGDLSGIDVYFDKIFSTFMFRLVSVTGFSISGVARNYYAVPLAGLQVYLTGAAGYREQVSTNVRGEFVFCNLEPGRYTIAAGDKSKTIRVRERHTPFNPLTVELKNVRRPIDVRNASVSEVQAALQVSSSVIARIRRQLGRIDSDSTLARIADVDSKTVERWKKTLMFSWKTLPRRRRLRSRPNERNK